MSEKAGALTNMILVIIALVALVIIFREIFPEIALSITDKMKNVIDNTTEGYSSIAPPSTFL